MVEAITSTGVVLNLTYNSDSSRRDPERLDLAPVQCDLGHPAADDLDWSVGPVSSTGTVAVTMPVQVSSTLAADADDDLYIAAYDPVPGPRPDRERHARREGPDALERHHERVVHELLREYHRGPEPALADDVLLLRGRQRRHEHPGHVGLHDDGHGR